MPEIYSNEFWHDLRIYQQEKWPNVPIHIGGTSSKPSERWPSFYKTEIKSKRIQINYSGERHVALYVKEVSFTDFKEAVDPILDQNMQVSSVAKSWQSVRIVVPSVDPEVPITEQIDKVDEILSAAKSLYAFYRTHAAILLKI